MHVIPLSSQALHEVFLFQNNGTKMVHFTTEIVHFVTLGIWYCNAKIYYSYTFYQPSRGTFETTKKIQIAGHQTFVKDLRWMGKGNPQDGNSRWWNHITHEGDLLNRLSHDST